jgi:hypothetical protein
MDSVKVSLNYNNKNGDSLVKDLELPSEVGIGLLLHGLVVALQLMEESEALGAKYLPYRLISERSTEPLSEDNSLKRCRIQDGEHLTLFPIASLITASGQRFILSGSKTRIGRRDSPADVMIDLTDEQEANTVHRSHAFIMQSDTDWVLIADDLARNRTLVNDREVKPGQWTPLHNGDRIRLGKVVLQFVCG